MTLYATGVRNAELTHLKFSDVDKQRMVVHIQGGKGRKDEVGGSGIYPASSPDAPADAEIRTEAELARHKGPRPTEANQQRFRKAGRSSGSE